MSASEVKGGSLTGMTGFEWRRALSGFDPGWWGGLGDRRTVLVMVGVPGTGQPVLDVARLAGTDPRLRVIFTAAPGARAAAVEALLRDAGIAPLPWREAEGGGFGLAVAATPVSGRVGVPLIVLPGTAPERVPNAPEPAGAPAVFAYAHAADRPAPAGAGTGPAAVVVGDSTHDRLVASLPLRDFYRRALGVGPHRKLVLVALPEAACGGARCRGRDVLRRLLTELPPRGYHVLGVPEPGPGPCTGGADLAVHLRGGLGLMPPDADWRAALVAADWILGPPGPVTRYGTITGVPVLLTEPLPDDAARTAGDRPGLLRCAGRLAPSGPVLPQLTEAAAWWRPDRVRPVVARITSEPGRFNRAVRRLMYGLLRLPQPATIPVADPVSPPFRLPCPAARPANACRGG